MSLLCQAVMLLGAGPALQAQGISQPAGQDTAGVSRLSDTLASLTPNPVYSPPFILPDTVEGYMLANIGQFARAGCPAGEIPVGASIQILFDIDDDSLLAVISPMFVTMLQIRPDGTVVQIFREQYRILPGQNLIRIIAGFPPGEYQAIYGFYLASQLKEKYPRLYGKRCRVKIVERSP
ncbi:MAG: hypothetical protein HUU32_12195 [Calditrichaceae bacterium]|nr:hypothetical protein [Calditrichia bacterium]NUQ42150.1 hypothetical protein [Calditrichaceae bacterium]